MVRFRRSRIEDVEALARIRAAEWETEEYWRERIAGYLEGKSNPRQALAARAAFVAMDGETPVGLVAGHLTRRFGCSGEIEWIDVVASHRRTGVGSELLRVMAEWFVEQRSTRVCVDAANAVARGFYAHNGAAAMNAHWMFWPDIGNRPRV